jgi:hypothetical protein
MSQLTVRQRAALDLVRLVTNLRNLVAFAYVALTWHILDLVSEKDALLKDQPFMMLASAVVITGLINGVGGFLFAATGADAEGRASAASAEPTPPAQSGK